VFGQAFEDVAREFQRTFGLLFPGGDGRLVLTEPDDILTSGVEIEARPPGKKVRRLSLLSGGGGSLVPAPAPLSPPRGAGRPSTTSTCTVSSTCSTTPVSMPSSWSSATSAAPWRPPTPSTGFRCRPRESARW